LRKILREEALEYHRRGRKGKVEVIPSKPCRTQEDLSLAYSPGVAEPWGGGGGRPPPLLGLLPRLPG
jgi:malic enzyme